MAQFKEVDAIILHNLRSAGCDLRDDMVSLSQLESHDAVLATASILTAIDPALQVPSKLPPEMSGKFRVGTELANACRAVGYRAELGYNQFLYVNETDIRKLLMWLVERLPKAAGGGEGGQAAVAFQQKVAAEIGRELTTVWTPNFLRPNGVQWAGTRAEDIEASKKKSRTGGKKKKQAGAVYSLGWFYTGCKGMVSFSSTKLEVPRATDSAMELKYHAEHMPSIAHQPAAATDVPASVLEANARQVVEARSRKQEWASKGSKSGLSEDEYRHQKKAEILGKMRGFVATSHENSRVGYGNLNSELDDVLRQFHESVHVSKDNSRFANAEKLQFAADKETPNQPKKSMKSSNGEAVVSADGTEETEEEIIARRERELEGLRTKLDELGASYDELSRSRLATAQSTKQMEQESAQQQGAIVRSEDEFKERKRVLDLLADPEGNLQRLNNSIEQRMKRLVEMGEKWEKVRRPLLDEARAMRANMNERMKSTRQLATNVEDNRTCMKDLKVQAREKDAEVRRMKAEAENIDRSINRNDYTDRVMEILNQLKRQRKDIDLVLGETRGLQREISVNLGVVDRSFSKAEDLIWGDKAIKTDEAVRKSYKYLVTIHENCQAMVKDVEDTATIINETKSLEDKIERLLETKVTSNLAKIQGDLEMVQAENQDLKKKARKARG